MGSFVTDLRHAFRLSLKAPVLTAVAVVTIALGTGANTAVFSLLNASLLRSPFSRPDSLIAIGNRFPNLENGPASYPDFVEWRRQSQTFENIAAYLLASVGIAGRGEPQRIPASLVSEGYFQALDISAEVGRLFRPEEHREGAPPVCLISAALWRREFQGRPDITRETVTLNGVAYSVIGVLPAKSLSFSYPEKTEVWIPLEPRAPFTVRGTNYLEVFGRLRPGITLARARAEMETIQGRINAEFPDNRHGMSLRPLSEELFGSTAPVLLVLFAAAGVVILIACANLANLLLARNAERSKEFAIRQALGAHPKRIIRQLLTEGLLIASLGGALGTLLACLSGKLLVALAPRGMRLPEAVDLDWRMAVFSLGLVVLVALISGISPAIQSSRVQLSQAVRVSTHQMTEGRRRLGMRQRLVTAEITLATILLAGAFITLESLWRLVQTNPGFVPEKLLTFQLSLSPSRYSEESRQARFFAQLLPRLHDLPGALAVGAITDLPIGQGGTTGDFVIEGREKPSPGDRGFVGKEIVSPGYFEAMKIPLMAGRFFTERDGEGAPKVAIISRRMAEQFWPGQNPVGRRIDLGLGKQDEWQEIVGVVGDVKTESLGQPAIAAGYLCSKQYPSSAMAIVMRTAVEPLSLLSAAKSAVFSVDGQQPVADVAAMDDILLQSLSQPRSLAWLLSAFAGIALLLASFGVYGLVAYSVTRRTAEIGIRMALGAGRAEVLHLMMGSGTKLVVIGLASGLVVSVGALQLLRHLLFGVNALDPLAFLLVAIFLGSAGLLACYIPARRAASIEPMRALRNG